MTWLLTGALALLLLGALIYGFTGIVPAFRSPAVTGAVLVALGAAAIFVPLQFVAAALLVANGTRKVWLEACRARKWEIIEDGLRAQAGNPSIGRDSQHSLPHAAAGSVFLDGPDSGKSPALGAPETTRGVPARIEELKREVAYVNQRAD